MKKLLGAVVALLACAEMAVAQPMSVGTVYSKQSGAWTNACTQSGTWTVQPGNTANTTPWLTTISQGGNSATVSAGGALKVDGSAVTQPVSGTVAATQSGTWVLGSNSGVDIGDVTVNNTSGTSSVFVQGQVANDVTFAGNPVVTGGIANSGDPTDVTSGDAVANYMDRSGRQIVLLGSATNLSFSVGTNSSSSGNTTVLAADAARKFCITGVEITKDDTTTASTYLITDGAGGTTLYQRRIAATNNNVTYAELLNPKCGTINTALVINSSAAVSYYVNLVGYRTANT